MTSSKPQVQQGPLKECLQTYHSFALPAYCKKMVTIQTEQDLALIRIDEAYLFLGEGTNTVFLEDYEGVVYLNKLKGIQIQEDAENYYVRVQGGENWHALVCKLNAEGIHGLENLALIPGSVGAAPIQNIGAYGLEVANFIETVTSWDARQRERLIWTNEECGFGYRTSLFKAPEWQHLFIIEVAFKLPKAWKPVLTYKELIPLQGTYPTAKEVMDKVIQVRESKLPNPTKIFNAGSFFKNPVIDIAQAKALQKEHLGLPCYRVEDPSEVKVAAGWLIEQSGLKGISIGGAQVYPKQALVLINIGHATGEHLLALTRHIQQEVWNKFQIMLEPEVQLIQGQGRLMQL